MERTLTLKALKALVANMELQAAPSCQVKVGDEGLEISYANTIIQTSDSTPDKFVRIAITKTEVTV